MRCLTCVLVVVVCAVSASAVTGQSTDPAFYVRRDTWQETVLASQDALIREQAAAEQQQTADRRADPKLRGFKSVEVEVPCGGKPRQIKVRVAGLDSVVIGCDGSDEGVFADPQLIPAGGAVDDVASGVDVDIDIEFDAGPSIDSAFEDDELERLLAEPRSAKASSQATRIRIERPQLYGERHYRHDVDRNWRPVNLGGGMFLHGLKLRRSEMVVPLEGKYEWLVAWVGSERRRDDQSQRYWVDGTSRFERQRKWAGAREDLRRLVARDFPQQHAERNLEEKSGIWEPDRQPGDIAEIARRYAQASGSEQKAEARALADAAETLADVGRVRDMYYVQHIEPRLELARATLALVEQSGPQPKLTAEFRAIQRRAADAAAGKSDGALQLYTDVRALRRRILLAHPALDFDKLLVNKRHHNVPGHMCDQYLGCHSRPGPGLATIDNWKDAPQETLLLADNLPPGMTYHPDLSFDGERVVFAHCNGTDRLRAFYLWEAAIDGSWARQITGTEDDPMQGWNGRQTVVIEDYDPCYLPDGGIAFTSTRSQQFGRCHGSRYVPSYCLYRCERDGSDIRRISLNEANEWNPAVLHDGRIVYCRWDYINRHDTRFQSLWVTRPDGTGTAHYYGNYSTAPCMITEARAIPGSHKTVATGTDHHGYTAGTIVTVDPHKGEDGPEPLLWVTPELSSPEGNLSGDTPRASAPLREDIPDSGNTRGRRAAASPFPITEDLFLVSYMYQGQYAVFLIDTLGGRELIYYDPEWSCFNPIPVRATTQPPVIPSQVAGKEDETTGRFFVQNVYQCSEPIEPGSIKSLRVNLILPQPTRSKPTLSRVANEILKRPLGTAPVAADGSVGFEAPANEPLQFQLLDENGMAVMTMRSLVYLMPGEEATCIGCHESRHGTPVAPPDLTAIRFHRLHPPAGPSYEGGFSFVRSVQPVLDRYCIRCHGLDRPEGGINLLGTFAGEGSRFTLSYDSLVNNGQRVKLAHRNGETWYSKPKDYFAHAGTLAAMLVAGHPDKDGNERLQLDDASLQRMITWLDLNGQFYGDYSFNRIEDQKSSDKGERALREAIAKRFGRELAEQPYAALVNKSMPSESRILKAPLAERAGGWGQIDKGAWTSTKDASYREMLELVHASITHPEQVDKAGTCGRESGCRCGCCYVRHDREAKQSGAAAGE